MTCLEAKGVGAPLPEDQQSIDITNAHFLIECYVCFIFNYL